MKTTPSKLPDPHSISSELDGATSRAIVTRLESRGEDAVFLSLFDTYFPELLSLAGEAGGPPRVLEVGAGTGIMPRRLYHQGFRGRVVGVDQSPFFVAEAQRLAEAEAVDKAVVGFAVADARRLREDLASYDAEQFDAIVLHTLISHVEQPLPVLQAVREVARPGARLYVIDGDYPSLTYGAAAGDVAAGEMESALVRATFASPDVARRLPALLAASGWGEARAGGTCVAEVGSRFSYWRSFGEAYLPRVKEAGLIAEERVDAWWAAKLEEAAQGRLFAACSYYTFRARAPRSSAL